MAELGINLYDDDSLDVAKDILWKSIESEAFEKSTIARPKAYCYLGIIKGRQNNYEKAFELLDQSISEFEGLEESQCPDFKESLAKAIANRGATYRATDSYPEALTDYTRAIELDPEYKWAIARRGEVRSLRGDHIQALQDFNHSLELDDNIAQQDYEANPLDHQNISNLAIYHLSAGKAAQAKHLYQDDLAKAPPAELMKEAICDLEDLLTVLPNFPNAEELRRYLKSIQPEHSA